MQEEKTMEYVETDLRQYTQLRTILDSVQNGALRDYCSATSQETRNDIFNYLNTNLKPIHDYLLQISLGGQCPKGEFDCGGYCSAYPCLTKY